MAGARWVAYAHGAREGGAPLVMLALVLAAIVALDAAGRLTYGLGLRRDS